MTSHAIFPDPQDGMIFGIEKAELTPNTIKVIKKNAGKIPPLDLALALCWTFKRLKRVAKAERIDLRYPPHDPREDAEPRGA